MSQVLAWLAFSIIGSYLICILLSFLVCLAFNLPWTWLIGTGVWAAALLLRYVFNGASSKPMIDLEYK